MEENKVRIFEIFYEEAKDIPLYRDYGAVPMEDTFSIYEKIISGGIPFKVELSGNIEYKETIRTRTMSFLKRRGDKFKNISVLSKKHDKDNWTLYIVDRTRIKKKEKGEPKGFQINN